MPVPDEIESRYYASRGFDADHARDVRSHYLQFVKGKRFLVELGCGRGEFLDLAGSEVERVLGVDIDPEMVEQAKAHGHEAELRDVLDYVSLTDDRPDAVFLAHLIEHLAVDSAFDLFGHLANIVEPGGVLIVVTPNPACLANLTADFWSDPTHVRLYTLDLLSFLFEQAGFKVIEAAGNPLDVPGPPPDLLAAEPLGDWGGADLSIAPRAPIQYDERFELETILDEQSRLRSAIEGLVHWVVEHDQRLSELRHLLENVAERHDSTLRHLYGPNEIYVVGERRP